ncbi:hypothetical protein Tco_1200348 [Tanacetum coccineum]
MFSLPKCLKADSTDDRDQEKENVVYLGSKKVMTFGVQKHGGFVAMLRQYQKTIKGQATGRKYKHILLGKGAGKVHLGMKVRANIMVTGVPGQEGAEGNVAVKKKVKEFMEANLGKLLK